MTLSLYNNSIHFIYAFHIRYLTSDSDDKRYVLSQSKAQ